MELIILVPGVLYIGMLVFAIIVLIKKKSNKSPGALSVLFVSAAVIFYAAILVFGLSFLHIMKFGIMSNRLPTAADLIFIYTVYIGLMAGACAIGAAGVTGKDPKAIRRIFIYGLIIPVLQVVLAVAEPYYKNINLAGVFKYASMKKFEIAGLRWGMQETYADRSYMYTGIPASEMCGHDGRILFKRFNFNKKLYRLETTYKTGSKKKQTEIIECIKARYGKPYRDFFRGPSCGCYTMRWRTDDTEIEMLVYDEEVIGAVTTPPYSMIAVDYQFMPPYLKDKSAAAYKGY
jgi:hypothetical protein